MPMKTVASHGKVSFSESITTEVVLKLKIEKGKSTAASPFSIKLWIYLFHVVVLQRYQTVKRTCCKSLSYKLESIVQCCTHAALTGLITAENFPALSQNSCLADCFASCENIVSRSQAFVSPPPPPQASLLTSRWGIIQLQGYPHVYELSRIIQESPRCTMNLWVSLMGHHISWIKATLDLLPKSKNCRILNTCYGSWLSFHPSFT